MAAVNSPNRRASLLSGLRTGGVRSTSSPLNNVPHTAAPGGAFVIPRFAVTPPSQQQQSHPEEDDEVAEMPQNAYSGGRQIPMTAAVDGPNNRFSQQQATARGMNPNSVPFTPTFGMTMQSPSPQVQAQALQMQMMQLEIMRLQTIQAQQYQAQLIAQAQTQQAQNRRASFNPPSTAGPLSTGFDLRSATLRRASQAEAQRSQYGEDQVPMTAALGGKFGSRTVSGRFGEDESDYNPPATPSQTTVISGGTSLGTASAATPTATTTPSKSDAAVSWRRGGNNSVLRSATMPVSPSVRITPPPTERVSPPPAPTAAPAAKARPMPLRFTAAVSQPLPAVAVDSAAESTDDTDNGTSSTGSEKSSGSPPTTPQSASSADSLSPREEAAKKLYQGLGMGRPAASATSLEPAPAPAAAPVTGYRMASQPLRQPRGPPSGADELGPKNFATRIRRKAIGGLGALMGARERREVIEAF